MMDDPIWMMPISEKLPVLLETGNGLSRSFNREATGCEIPDSSEYPKYVLFQGGNMLNADTLCGFTGVSDPDCRRDQALRARNAAPNSLPWKDRGRSTGIVL
jgi:hypothetical protein